MLGLSTATPRRFTTALTVLGLLTAGATLQASVATPAAAATTHRVLFDNAHAETAGNADWIVSTSQPDPLGQDSSPSAESDWTGAL
ncbi:hydrolase, partial [Streptomyces canus]